MRPLSVALRRLVRGLARRDDAATMAEYALLLALIAFVALAGAKTLGSSVNTSLGGLASSVAADGQTTPTTTPPTTSPAPTTSGSGNGNGNGNGGVGNGNGNGNAAHAGA